MLLINDLSAKLSSHRSRIMGAVDRVMDSGWLVLGPEVKRFEQSFAAYLGACECVSLANGTDALELALKAMGIKAGDRVATAANAGFYATAAILSIGAEPYFLDVDLETRVITLAEAVRAGGAGVNAIVATHLYGLAVPEIAKISEYCRKTGISLLEDCAQSHGARVNGQCAGTFGDAASFSFYPTKNLGALGDGGAVVTNGEKIAGELRRLRQYGWSAKYQVETAGGRNSRLDEMQAAVLTELLPHLDKANARRRQIAALYNSYIRHDLVISPHASGEAYVAHLYVVRCDRRDELRQHLESRGIGSDIHYPIPDYRQPAFGTRFADTYLGHTERLAKEVLTLPCYPEMSDADVEAVISAVNSWQSGA